MNANRVEADRIATAGKRRFGELLNSDSIVEGRGAIATMLEHSSFRQWADRAVEPDLLRLACAAALSSPSKGDMQQADIIQVVDPAIRRSIVDHIDGMDWILSAPAFFIFCGNGRRMHRVSGLRGKSFNNDHLDHFFNVTVDAALILGRFIAAAEAVDLGCCPVSGVRDRADEISGILRLPDRVFPVAGLCVGYPSGDSRITPRLPLDVTLHTDHFDDSDLPQLIEAYDRRRHDVAPYRSQRDIERFGSSDFYTWSEEKARQSCVDERRGFGAFVRAKRFSLD